MEFIYHKEQKLGVFALQKKYGLDAAVNITG